MAQKIPVHSLPVPKPLCTPLPTPPGPLNSLNPWPRQPYPLKAKLRVKQMGGPLSGQQRKTNKSPWGFLPYSLVRAAGSTQGPGSKPGTEQQFAGLLRTQSSRNRLSPGLVKSVRIPPCLSSPRVPTWRLLPKWGGRWPLGAWEVGPAASLRTHASLGVKELADGPSHSRN